MCSNCRGDYEQPDAVAMVCDCGHDSAAHDDTGCQVMVWDRRLGKKRLCQCQMAQWELESIGRNHGRYRKTQLD